MSANKASLLSERRKQRRQIYEELRLQQLQRIVARGFMRLNDRRIRALPENQQPIEESERLRNELISR